MYSLNEFNQIVDVHGRVLVGIDGAAISVSGPQQVAKEASVSSPKVSGPRPAAPKQFACDMPLCTVMPGSLGSKYFVGEMMNPKSATRSVVKRWFLFKEPECVALSDEELSQLAWSHVQAFRASAGFSSQELAGLKTPQEDAIALQSMDVAPSKLARREKDLKIRAKRVAEGRRQDGRAKGHDNKKNLPKKLAVKKSM